MMRNAGNTTATAATTAPRFPEKRSPVRTAKLTMMTPGTDWEIA